MGMSLATKSRRRRIIRRERTRVVAKMKAGEKKRKKN